MLTCNTVNVVKPKLEIKPMRLPISRRTPIAAATFVCANDDG